MSSLERRAPEALPLQVRQAPVSQDSISVETRTIDVVFTAGATVRRRRYDGWDTVVPFDETLLVSRDAVDLTRLNAGAPVLDSHSSYSTNSQVAVVERAWIEGNEGKATIRFPREGLDDRADRMFALVSDGIIRNVSIGYSIDKLKIVEAERKGQVEQHIAERWTPFEISFVTIPADVGAGVRSDEGELHPVEVDIEAAVLADGERNGVEMADAHPELEAGASTSDESTETTISTEARVADTNLETRAAPAADAVDATRAAGEASQRAISAERKRISEIRKLAKEADAIDLGDEHIDSGTPVDGFRSTLLDHMMKRESPSVDNRSPARVGEEHHEKRAAVMGEALQHRVNPTADLTDGAREYRGFTLLDMARESLELRGERTRGLSRDEIAQRALAQRSGAYMSSSDFPVILGNVINTSLRAGYDQAPQTFRPLVREVSAADFKAINRAQLGEGPAFDKINESGEYKRGSLVEAKESYGIATFGKVIAITRKVIVNDDMNAFGRIPQLLGQSAAQLESDLVWYQILANPTMGDGTALFHTDHKNLQSGAGSAFGVAALGTGRATMAKQVGLDGKTVLNIRPQYVIVPVALETKAEQELKTLVYNSDSSKTATASMRSLEIITEARLDNGISNKAVGADVAGSAVAWYLAASSAQIDTIELAYLEGQRGVYTETRNGFDVDGMEVKARLDVGAKTIDHRGLQKSNGS